MKYSTNDFERFYNKQMTFAETEKFKEYLDTDIFTATAFEGFCILKESQAGKGSASNTISIERSFTWKAKYILAVAGTLLLFFLPIEQSPLDQGIHKMLPSLAAVENKKSDTIASQLKTDAEPKSLVVKSQIKSKRVIISKPDSTEATAITFADNHVTVETDSAASTFKTEEVIVIAPLMKPRKWGVLDFCTYLPTSNSCSYKASRVIQRTGRPLYIDLVLNTSGSSRFTSSSASFLDMRSLPILKNNFAILNIGTQSCIAPFDLNTLTPELSPFTPPSEFSMGVRSFPMFNINKVDSNMRANTGSFILAAMYRF